MANGTNFKVGDKFRLISGGGDFPLSGAENGEIYEVVSDLRYNHGPYGDKTYKFYYNERKYSAFAKPEQMQLVASKPTKNQRIETLEQTVATLERRIEALESGKSYTHTQRREYVKPPLTPNSRRKAIIAEAKAFVEKTLAEKASQSYEGGIVIGGCYAVPKFFVNDKKRVVTFIAEGPSTKAVRAKAIAKCAPDDVFNADIGKAIALGRALGLDVSRFEQAVKPSERVVGMKAIHNGEICELTNEKIARGNKASVNSFWAEQSTITDDTEAVY